MAIRPYAVTVRSLNAEQLNRQDACSTKSEFSCETGILPVQKRVIDNAATSQFKPC